MLSTYSLKTYNARLRCNLMIMNWISTLGEKEDFTNIKLFFLYVLDMLILFLNYGLCNRVIIFVFSRK